MKKLGILVALLSVGAIIIFSNKIYYPSLPIDSITQKEAIRKINTSSNDLVELSKDHNATWYITAISTMGIQKVDADIQQLMENEGWVFLEKEGSGLFFEKNEERTIITTEMWTKQYVLIQVPAPIKQ
ncbi:hypothetical protein U1P98_22125 [Lysinibacillus irui]|uniref:Uncharacterized protein n=1 Tax=Lysinibacillus irui TaxID=2998077 RepID=A0ABU5NSK7_9BACI|nr:hypothetical protein [Lysinibacillus irui]MEA0553242.1 hypothetical protein [Lysinibacillus irui]MEA0978998.1 hypothetical protein [Lysinibacillus irui]MEA1045152.1 hypothetical protein [Lysinibacillus irui]